MGGVPCFRGTTVPFRNLTDYLAGGESLEEFLRRENLHADAQHVGGHVNRTVYFSIQTGRVTLKVSGLQNEIILC